MARVSTTKTTRSSTGSASLKKSTIVPSKYIFSIVGSDEGTIKAEARKLVDELAPADAGDFGIEVVDGAADNVATAVGRIHQTVEALQTLPFFGGSKVVWLKNVNFLSDTVIGRSNSVLEALENLTSTLSAGLTDDVKFVINAIDVDKRRSFYKLLSKLGKVQVFDKIDSSRSGWEEEAAQVAKQFANELGLSFKHDAGELFAMLTGGDSHQMRNELEKISLYLGNSSQEISTEDVRLMVPLTRQGIVFELGNAFIEKNLKRCLDLIAQLLKQGESAVGILFSTLIPTVRNLLLVKDLQERFNLPRVSVPFLFPKTLDRLPSEATTHLPRKKDGTLSAYALGFAAVGAHRFELETLKHGLGQCLETNLKLVTTQLNEQLVLEELVINLMS